MKKLLEELRRAEELANQAERAYEAEPMNDEAEYAFDRAYAAEMKVREEVIRALMTVCNCERKVANAMLSGHRDELEDILRRA